MPPIRQFGLFGDVPIHAEFSEPSGALFDPGDQSYRYLLWRIWEWGDPNVRLCNFVMLNPSTADAFEPDPTITRCIAYARRWGFGGLVVTNLFGLRSTDPQSLYSHPEPIGKGNDALLLKWAHNASLVVCGWGNHGAYKGRGRKVADILRACGIALNCFSLTKAGHPIHPLYQRANADLIVWEQAA